MAGKEEQRPQDSHFTFLTAPKVIVSAFTGVAKHSYIHTQFSMVSFRPYYNLLAKISLALTVQHLGWT